MTPEAALEKLNEYRKNIDRIDLQLVALLNERTRIVKAIGSVKAEFQLPIYEPKREEEVYHNVLEHNHGPLGPEAVRRIFERLIDEMRTVQKMEIEA